MDCWSTSDILFSDACLVYCVTGVFCALVRWFHVCGPYSGAAADYYYPARKQLSFFYAFCIFQFPYVMNPTDGATWIYVGIFGMLYYPVCFAMLFRRYFDRRKLYDSWRGLIFTTLPLTMLLALCIAALSAGDWVVAHRKALWAAGGVTGIALMSYTATVAVQLKRKIDKYHYDTFSCEHDFPYRFAERVVWLPFFWFALSLSVFLSGNRWMKFGVDLAMTVQMVFFLIKVLHPQRMSPDGAETGAEYAPEADESGPEDGGEIARTALADSAEREAIHRELAETIKRMYLNSGLLKTDVINEIDYGKKTLAKEYISEVGFYNFVNAFRLEHARLYREAHPMATLDQIAEVSGFRDRFALNYAKKKITFDCRSLTRDFHPDVK